jgi:phosphate transport system permease protein
MGRESTVSIEPREQTDVKGLASRARAAPSLREESAPDPASHVTDEHQGRPVKRKKVWNFSARGEPFIWGFGGALAFGIAMIFGFLTIVVWNGLTSLYPKPIQKVTLRDGSVAAGEEFRTEIFRPDPDTLKNLSVEDREKIEKRKGFATRTLYRTGNYDLYNEDFRWVPEYQVSQITTPPDLFFVERTEWGPFIGTIRSVDLNGKIVKGTDLGAEDLSSALAEAAERRRRILKIEKTEMGEVNHYLEQARLTLKGVEMKSGRNSTQYEKAKKEHDWRCSELQTRYRELEKEAVALKTEDGLQKITLADVSGREKTLRLSQIVRMYPANCLTTAQKVGLYLSRWKEFLTDEPREANTEGGVLPAIFGTCLMTIFMALAVTPFGVTAALYLREYAKQGRVVSAVRISVNNLAGVPSIVYGVFGLGFFAYMVGAGIDRLFFAERLPNPTFGTGGLLWSSLTLALLTVPVVIVATEEALAAVPQSMREGSLACGASKWQTIKYIVLPRAMPGIMTGIILAMARGAGEVAPLMLVGVVKIAPELPIDHFFPYLHLERSFMHLGFHIYDLGFQSRNSEAAKPMVFATTLLLIAIVAVLNATAIVVRNRLRRKFSAGHF